MTWFLLIGILIVLGLLRVADGDEKEDVAKDTCGYMFCMGIVFIAFLIGAYLGFLIRGALGAGLGMGALGGFAYFKLIAIIKNLKIKFI